MDIYNFLISGILAAGLLPSKLAVTFAEHGMFMAQVSLSGMKLLILISLPLRYFFLLFFTTVTNLRDLIYRELEKICLQY